MHRFYLILLILLPIAVKGQTLTIVDQTTLQPVPDVAIRSVSPQALTYTDARGKADISAFKGADSIAFIHVNFLQSHASYQQLEGMGFMMALVNTNISLDEVIVSVSRWEGQQSNVPNRVEKIGIREIAFQNPQTSADVLAGSGQVYVQKSQMAGGSPMLRGFSTNRVMLVVDGVRMNNAIFRSGNLQNVISIDAHSLQSTEVLFGPGSVMYGSDAIGGVMHFHTLKPRFSSNDTALFTGKALTRYSSANNEKTGHFDLSIGLKKWAFVTGFTYSDYDDLRAGSNGNSYFLRPVYQATVNGTDTQFINPDPQVQVHSGFSQMNFIQKIHFIPAEKLSVDYSFQYSQTSDAPRYDRLILDADNDGLLDNAEWYYGPQKWMMNRLGIIHWKTNKLYNRLHVTAAMQNYEESRHDRKRNSSSLRHQTETVDAYSLNLDLDKKIGKKISLFYGAEAVYNLIGSAAYREKIETGEQTPINTRYPDGSVWQMYGAYANMNYSLNPKWILSGGLRYSYYQMKAEFDTAFFDFPFTEAENSSGAVNGSAGVVFRPSGKWQLYANASTGFRAPNIDDMGKVFDSEPGSVVVPNPALKPEYAYNAEAGIAKIFGDFMKAELAVYYTYLDDALARRDFQYNGQDSIMYDGEMSRVMAIQNITSAYVYGTQAEVEWSMGKGFALRSTINWQKGEEYSEDSLAYFPLRHAPPLFGSTHITYERKKMKFDLYSDYNAGLEYSELALSEIQDDAVYAKDEAGRPFVPSWYTLNFKAAWFVNKYLALNAGVENITDKLYRPYASGISAPGRNFIISVRGSF